MKLMQIRAAFDSGVSLIRRRVRSVAVFAAAAAASAVSAAGNASAMTWPPTAADLATAFGSVVTTIGDIFAAAVTAGLVLYGGYLAVMSAIRFFSKFVRTTTSG